MRDFFRSVQWIEGDLRGIAMAGLRLPLGHGVGAVTRHRETSFCTSASLRRTDSGAVGLRMTPAVIGSPRRETCTFRVAQRCRSPVLKIQAAKQTFSSFNDMITNSEIPVLVDFYATWCGPCQLMAPILDEVGAAMKDKIRVVKVDTEKYNQVASRYGIQALPTLVLFVKGKPIKYLEGVQDKKSLIVQINQILDSLKANV